MLTEWLNTPRTIAYLLSEYFGDNRKDCLTTFTLSGVLVNLDGPKGDASAAEPRHIPFQVILNVSDDQGRLIFDRRLE